MHRKKEKEICQNVRMPFGSWKSKIKINCFPKLCYFYSQKKLKQKKKKKKLKPKLKKLKVKAPCIELFKL